MMFKLWVAAPGRLWAAMMILGGATLSADANSDNPPATTINKNCVSFFGHHYDRATETGIRKQSKSPALLQS